MSLASTFLITRERHIALALCTKFVYGWAACLHVRAIGGPAIKRIQSAQLRTVSVCHSFRGVRRTAGPHSRSQVRVVILHDARTICLKNWPHSEFLRAYSFIFVRDRSKLHTFTTLSTGFIPNTFRTVCCMFDSNWLRAKYLCVLHGVPDASMLGR